MVGINPALLANSPPRGIHDGHAKEIENSQEKKVEREEDLRLLCAQDVLMRMRVLPGCLDATFEASLLRVGALS